MLYFVEIFFGGLRPPSPRSGFPDPPWLALSVARAPGSRRQAGPIASPGAWPARPRMTIAPKPSKAWARRLPRLGLGFDACMYAHQAQSPGACERSAYMLEVDRAKCRVRRPGECRQRPFRRPQQPFQARLHCACGRILCWYKRICSQERRWWPLAQPAIATRRLPG